ncbi:MAG: sulfate transporter [Mycobacterium sp.]|nr:sulfate transporter [Mycobacterium sp.]
MRSVAVVITVSGWIDPVAVDRLGPLLGRFAQLDGPLIVNFTAVTGDSASAMGLLAGWDAECRRCGVEWLLVAPPSLTWRMPAGEGPHPLCAASVEQALQHCVAVIRERRTMLLQEPSPVELPDGTCRPVRVRQGADALKDELAQRRRSRFDRMTPTLDRPSSERTHGTF